MQEFIEIPTTRGYVARVSPEDFDRVSGFKWYAVTPINSTTAYAYAYIPGEKGKRVQLHRLVMNAKDGEQVEHKDRCGMNCVRGNLRHSTQSQNCANRPSLVSTTGFKGVSFHKLTGKYQAYIKKDQKRRHLGLFPTKEKAALAYNVAAIQCFGEFALLNTVADG